MDFELDPDAVGEAYPEDSNDEEANNSAAASSTAGKSEGSRQKRRCGRHKASSSKGGKVSGKKYCRGCGCSLPADQFALNQNLHFECKKARDNVWKLAKRQNSLGWFQQVEQDEERFAQLLTRYKQQSSAGDSGGKSKGKFSLAAVKESWQASTQVLTDDVGEMMCEEEYFDFARTIKGGKHSSTQAKLKWDSMVSDKKNQVWDLKGPAEAPLRFRVSKADLVIFRNAHVHAKTAEVTKSTSKNVDGAALTAMRNDIMTNHQMEDGQGVGELARNMVQASAHLDEEGFVGAFDGAHVGDLKSFLSDCSADEKEEAGSGKQEAKGETPTKGGKPLALVLQPLEKRAWFDRDNAVSKAQRQWLRDIDKLRVDFDAGLAAANEMLIECKAHSENPHFKKAYLLCARRTTAAQLVLGEDSAKLQEHIDDLKHGRAITAPAAVTASSKSTSAGLTAAPPCKNYEDLRTVKVMAAMSEEFEPANSQEEIKAVSARINSFKVVARELLASWRMSAKELQKAHKGFSQALEQSEKEKVNKRRAEEAASKAKKKARVGNTIMEFLQSKATAMRVISAGDADWAKKNADLFLEETELNALEPYLVVGVSLDFVRCEGDSVAKSFSEFAADFKTSDIRKTAGRGMRRNLDQTDLVDASANKFLAKCLAQYIPKNSITAPAFLDGTPLRLALGLFNFGEKMNSKSISVEKDYLWTGRLSIYGTRCVAIFDLGAVNDFMRKAGVVGVDAKAFLQGLKEDTVDKLLSDGVQVWLATVGPGDFLMVPSHVMIMEDVLGEDCYGLRMAAVVPRDSKGCKLFHATATNPATPSSHMAKSIAAAIASAPQVAGHSVAAASAEAPVKGGNQGNSNSSAVSNASAAESNPGAPAHVPVNSSVAPADAGKSAQVGELAP